MSDFRDHFSSLAASYAAFRPTQPAAVIAYAVSQASRRDMAWDCATGNGHQVDKHSRTRHPTNVTKIARAILPRDARLRARDQLFFFGFSSGAFTVRTLAGIMNFVGLIEKSDDYFIPELFDCCEKGGQLDSPDAMRMLRHLGSRTSVASNHLHRR